MGELRIARYWCAGCGGRWQVLPAFVPRRLWFHWPQVEVGRGRAGPRPLRERGREPSERTVQRWWARLMSAAWMITQVLASSAEATLVGVAQRVGLLATRVELVDAIDRGPPSARSRAAPFGAS